MPEPGGLPDPKPFLQKIPLVLKAHAGTCLVYVLYTCAFGVFLFAVEKPERAPLIWAWLISSAFIMLGLLAARTR